VRVAIVGGGAVAFAASVIFAGVTLFSHGDREAPATPVRTVTREATVLTDETRVIREQEQRSHSINVDGKFEDWENVRSYTDPPDDQHDTDGKTQDYQHEHIDHPDVDLLEFKFTHDAQTLYGYWRARGAIGRTQKGQEGKRAGRYHAIIAIDVDNNDETGYWLHEGGYFPTSRGYDINAEVEWFDGQFNAGQYLNHCCKDAEELKQAFLDQSSENYKQGNDGPYPAGFMKLGPGVYDHYTQWSYHKDGTITFTLDMGPVVPGIITVGISPDGHELEMGIPMKGSLVDQQGKPIIALKQTLDVSFSLEASGELAPNSAAVPAEKTDGESNGEPAAKADGESAPDSNGRWASDTGEPIKGYVLEIPAGP
jgi:hypothetical protein